MSCNSAAKCTCPNTTCKNHGKCCACVNHHHGLGRVPRCMEQLVASATK